MHMTILLHETGQLKSQMIQGNANLRGQYVARERGCDRSNFGQERQPTQALLPQCAYEPANSAAKRRRPLPQRHPQSLQGRPSRNVHAARYQSALHSRRGIATLCGRAILPNAMVS
jgi:hypothetical protein